MSRQNIETLLSKAEADPEVADALKRATGTDALVQLGASHKLDFSAQELEQYAAEVHSNELDTDQLEQVSGGSGGSRQTYLKYEMTKIVITGYSNG